MVVVAGDRSGLVAVDLALFGAERVDSGEITLAGRTLKLKNTSAARDAGIAYVPENRRNSLVLQQEIFKNITLAHLGHLIRGLLNQRAELALAAQWSAHVGVRPAGRPLMEVGALSGGNQQKVVLAKWLTRRPKFLILNEPTRGMDVGAKDEVMAVVQGLAAKGVATLLITPEPETIVAYAGRSLVMSKGRITAELSGAAFRAHLAAHVGAMAGEDGGAQVPMPAPPPWTYDAAAWQDLRV